MRKTFFVSLLSLVLASPAGAESKLGPQWNVELTPGDRINWEEKVPDDHVCAVFKKDRRHWQFYVYKGFDKTKGRALVSEYHQKHLIDGKNSPWPFNPKTGLYEIYTSDTPFSLSPPTIYRRLVISPGASLDKAGFGCEFTLVYVGQRGDDAQFTIILGDYSHTRERAHQLFEQMIKDYNEHMKKN